MNRRGFTIVELVVVITLMGILLVLGVVNLEGSQANARDSERKGDVESIILSLEAYYKSGSDVSTTIGKYPSTLITTNTVNLRDLDTSAIKAPGVSNPLLSFIAATNNVQTTTGVIPQPTISQYIYQPLELLSNGTWALCTNSATQECRKYNIYYRLEADNTVYMLSSKSQ